jgi:hypothetical protein
MPPRMLSKTLFGSYSYSQNPQLNLEFFMQTQIRHEAAARQQTCDNRAQAGGNRAGCRATSSGTRPTRARCFRRFGPASSHYSLPTIDQFPLKNPPPPPQTPPSAPAAAHGGALIEGHHLRSRNLVRVALPGLNRQRRGLLPAHVASCGVASLQAPSPRESLSATIAQSDPVGPDPRRLAGALSASNPSAPFRNCNEILDCHHINSPETSAPGTNRMLSFRLLFGRSLSG